MYTYSFLDKIKNHKRYDSKFKQKFLKGGGSCNSSQIACTDEEEVLVDINCTRHSNAKSVREILTKIDCSNPLFNKKSCEENYEIMTLEKFILLFGNEIPVNILSEYLSNILCSLSTKSEKSKRSTKRHSSEIRLGRFGTIIDHPEVSDAYIQEKIEKHLSSSDINSSKYLIYMVVINEQNYELPKDCTNKYYLEYPELSRILAFTVLDDSPCIPKKNYLSINIICSINRLSHSKDQGKYKLVGKYLLLFIFAKAFLENFNKIILEVTNEVVPIETIVYDELKETDDDNYFLDCPIKTNDCKINISRKELEDGKTRFSCPCGIIIDYEEEDSEEEDSEEEDSEEVDSEEEDGEEEDGEEEDGEEVDSEEEDGEEEDSEEEDSEEEDSEEEDSEEVDSEEEDSEDEDSEDEDSEDEDNDLDFIKDISKRDNDHFFRLYKYGGLLYKKGKLSTKGLYTKVYTRYGFSENPDINKKEYCFGLDSLPSMEFNIPKSVIEKNCSWNNLMEVFLGIKKEYIIGKIDIIEKNLITIEKEIEITEHILNKNVKDAYDIFSILSDRDIENWFKVEKIRYNSKSTKSELFENLYNSINN